MLLRAVPSMRMLKPGQVSRDWSRVLTHICILALSLAAAAQTNKAGDFGSQSAAAEVTVDGCLYGSPGGFAVVGAENSYALHGDAATLQKHLGEEVRVTGVARAESDELDVARIETVFRAPTLQLPAAITDDSNWKTQVNGQYGVKFALPTLPNWSKSGERGTGTNLVSEAGAVTLANLDIPSEIYPSSNFTGGIFLLSVNPTITNRGSCEKFGIFDPHSVSHPNFGGATYSETSEGDAAAGSSSNTEYFHTFQNGVCFEIAVTVGFYSTASQDFGCRVSTVGDAPKLVDEFTHRVSYFPVSAKVGTPKQESIPRVTAFTASSEVADGAMNRGTITFSWTTENTDYVEFSYSCSASGLGTVINEEGARMRNCENDPKPITPDPDEYTHSSNSSGQIGFGNFHHDDPIFVTVNIVPFSHGKAYPSEMKSIKITVDPYNPYPNGIPSKTANIALSYAGPVSKSYKQGEMLTVTWTDNLSRDSCVNLLLARDSASGVQYVGRVSEKCLSPASSGSYNWTIPKKYAGAGFRVYASAPGGESSALGPSFEIVPGGTEQK